MIVIADSSPLIALATCGALDLLTQLFSQIWVTPEVFSEVTQAGKPFATELERFLQDKQSPVKPSALPNLTNLDIGEISAIVLYQQLKADILLIDEKAGRQVATSLNITVVGSLGVLVMAKQRGLIGEIKPFVERLAGSPIFFSPTLLQQVLNVVNE